MDRQRKVRFAALASYLPEKILTNHDLEAMVNTSDEWIQSRTGMKERRIAGERETTSVMGAKAAERALLKAGKRAEEIDLIIVATMTPDYQAPSTAVLIQAALGAKNAAAFDLSATCGGYLYLLSVAKAYLSCGSYRNVLIIASEKMSSIIDYTDRNTCVLFGDGATAALLEMAEGGGLELDWVNIHSDGTLAHLSKIPAGGCEMPASEESVKARLHYFQMNGREIFRHAVRAVAASTKSSLAHHGVDPASIRYVVAHQANVRMLDVLAEYLSIDHDRFHKVIHKYGNTSASSVGIAFDDLLSGIRVEKGDQFLLLAFGIGLTWATALVTRR